MDDFEAWIAEFDSSSTLTIKPWERVNLLEYVAGRPGDAGALARVLLDGPLPLWRLDEFLNLAAAAGNEEVALALLAAGATARPVAAAARGGLVRLLADLVSRGARVNRRFASEAPPLHLALATPRAAETAAVLVEAACDLTVRDPAGRQAWDLADATLGATLREAVGRHGPRWFREAQAQGIDHYVFYDDGQMLGFNPNDVQTPVWTGDDDSGFGWPNTPAQGLELLAANRRLEAELAWFVPFLERMERGEDFGLDDLPTGYARRRQ